MWAAIIKLVSLERQLSPSGAPTVPSSSQIVITAFIIFGVVCQHLLYHTLGISEIAELTSRLDRS